MKLKHIAIIMDGNGRWAEQRGWPRSDGHRAGTEAARRISRAAGRMNIPFLTLYALSTENLYRPQEELDALTTLMRHYLETEINSLIENKVRLNIIGDRSLLPSDLRKQIARVETETSRDYDKVLSLAICYGGRNEIVRAVKSLAGKTDLKRLTEDRLTKALDTAGVPDPDLLIRTGGDLRISNFLIWELAYTELYFTRVLWPDFSPRHLRTAIDSFQRRERRFGRTDNSTSRKSKKKIKGRLR